MLKIDDLKYCPYCKEEMDSGFILVSYGDIGWYKEKGGMRFMRKKDKLFSYHLSYILDKSKFYYEAKRCNKCRYVHLPYPENP